MKDVIRFMRVKIALFGASIAGLGAISNSNNLTYLAMVFISAFFLTSGTYSYNLITDVEEDTANKRALKINKKTAITIVIISYLIGLIASVMLNINHALLYSFLLLASFSYSAFRFKRFLLFKNAYISLNFALLFLFGTMSFNNDFLLEYFILVLIFLCISIIADLKDLEGDKKAGLRTIPIVIGKQKSVTAVMSLMLIGLIAVTFSDVLRVYALFLVISLLMLFKHDYTKAHVIMIMGFILSFFFHLSNFIVTLL